MSEETTPAEETKVETTEEPKAEEAKGEEPAEEEDKVKEEESTATFEPVVSIVVLLCVGRRRLGLDLCGLIF
jgi:hypothetical protein